MMAAKSSIMLWMLMQMVMYERSAFAVPLEIPSSCTESQINATACCTALYSQCTFIGGESMFNCSNGGVITDSNLINLTMRKCGLNGTIPDTITQLPYLQTLDLSGNYLSGQIPESVGSIGNKIGIQYLDLSHNSLTGTIPKSIGAQTTLRHLDISDNQLVRMNLPSITNLESLEYLDLSNNQIAESFHVALTQFLHLKYLNLGTNRISSSIPSGIVGLTELSVLNLERNDMSGSLPAELSQMGSLSVLNISDNKFSGVLPSEWAEIWQQQPIDHLNIGNNEFDCPVLDYSSYGVQNDYVSSYGEDGETNCVTPSSDDAASKGLDGVEVAIIVIATVSILAAAVWCWHSRSQGKVKRQVRMLSEEDVFDDD